MDIYDKSDQANITDKELLMLFSIYNKGEKDTISDKEIKELIKDTRKELLKVEIDWNVKPLRIGIVGEIYSTIDSNTKPNSSLAMETSLDVEWAHAIAPNAKILLIESKTQSGTNLLKAIDYASSRKDVVAISMSWGGAEFPDETTLDSHFKSVSGASFFASSGDNGTGASWPASSPNVISVGGTTLNLKNDGTFISETAWSGSGGGISAYEKEPDYQKNFKIPKSSGMRAIPDVSFGADPKTGFAIYKSGSNKKGWYIVGGTSASAPQWAGIQALGLSAKLSNIYKDKSTSENNTYFRDIKNGSNGDCSYYCDARTHYDYITGLGSPLTINF